MKIVIYGLAVTSSWGNGHATTYRSLCKALARRGHHIDFVERDTEWYRGNRDLPKPEFCTLHLYDKWTDDYSRLVSLAADADAVVIGSYFPDAIAATRELLETGCGPLIFYDIDTPVTIARLRLSGATEYLERDLIPNFAAYLSFAGGPILGEIEQRFGSPLAVPFYCSVDPDLHRPALSKEKYQCALGYLGTYAEDRQPGLMRLLNGSASRLPHSRFIVAGPMYPRSIQWSKNVERIVHLSPSEHPSFYCSSRFTVNLTRNDMIASGFAPSVRLFEAAACGAAILSDWWEGLDQFLTPNQEVMLATDTDEVVRILDSVSEEERKHLGRSARERICAQHTSQHRAIQFEQVVEQCGRRHVTPAQSTLASTKDRDLELLDRALPVNALPLPQQ